MTSGDVDRQRIPNAFDGKTSAARESPIGDP